MPARKSGLGKNLNVFLSNAKSVKKQVASTSSPSEQGKLLKLAVNKLQPGVYQPRKDMTEQALAELSASIKQQGLLQPIVVRKLASADNYEIIAGERRWRASKLAGLKQVPVIVHEVDDKTSLAMALVENIQREDLNPIEEARALARLIEEFELTHQQAADIVGKSRVSVSNLLRLMNLQLEVQTLLERGDIEMGHARALLAIEGAKQVELARAVVDKGLTVRETEALVRRHLAASEQGAEVSEAEVVKIDNKHVTALQRRLSKQIGNKVKVKPTAQGKIKVEIIYDDMAAVDAFAGRFE